MRLRLLPLVALVLLAAPAAAQQPRALSDAELTTLGGNLSRWLLGGTVDSVLAHVSSGLAASLEGAPGVARTSQKLATTFGMEVEVLEERISHTNGVAEYWRTVSFIGHPDQTWVWHWTFDATGRATDYGLDPLPATKD